MKAKKVLAWFLALAVATLVIAGTFYVVYVRPMLNELMQVKTIRYDKELTLVLGGGGNSGILVGDSVVLVVDTKFKEPAAQFYNTVKQLAGDRHIVVVNTHVHNDHTDGNHYYKGATIIAGANYGKEFWVSDVCERNLPTQWLKDSLMLKIGDDTACIFNLPWKAHTQSDVVVYLQHRKVLFAGDLVLNKKSPAMFKKYESRSKGYLAAFDWMQRNLAITTVVPGHGAPGGTELIDNFRQFFEDMRAVAAGRISRTEVLAHYNNWTQIPLIMSSGATITYIKEEE